MFPEYDLARLGYPDELRRFTELVEGVERTGEPLVITRFGRPVAVIMGADDIALLRQRIDDLKTAPSDDSEVR